MKLLRLAGFGGALALFGLGLGGCLQEPTYSTTPQIDPDNVVVRRYTPTNPREQAIDTFRITIRYQDGDGDLGLSSDERKVPPFDKGKFFNNYFIEPFILNRRTKQFEPLTVVGVPPGSTPYVAGSYNSAFQRPTALTDGKPAPIKGTLTYKQNIGLGDRFAPGQAVRFEISIADRALHVSNTIVTDTVRIARR